MRIAVIVPALNRKAPVVIATTLAVELKERGNEVSIFYFDDTVEMDLDPSISTRRISSGLMLG